MFSAGRQRPSCASQAFAPAVLPTSACRAEPELRSLPPTGLDGEGEEEAAVDEPEELAPPGGADGFDAPEPLDCATAE